MGSSDFISNGINEENCDIISDEFPVVTADVVSFGLFEISMLVIDDYFKLVEYIYYKEGEWLG